MKIKTLRHAVLLAAGCALLAGSGSSQQVRTNDYVLLSDSPGLSTLALRDAIEPLFTGDGDADPGETRALIVMRGGKVIAERYGPGFGPQSRLLSWSLAKTVTGLIAGIMVSDGRLALDDPAPIPAWRQPGDPRAAITLRELLQMRSGLQNLEYWSPSPRSDALDMMVGDGAADQRAFAVAKPLVEEPGKTFNYSTATSMIVAGILTDQLTASPDPKVRRDTMARFLAARFAGPLGLTGFVPEFDESGTFHGGAMMHMTARDYARIGELIRRRGNIDGHQLVEERWFDFMLAPSPANAAYAGHIWLNRTGEHSALFPDIARRDLIGAAGNRGQFILISPAQKLTIIRLGNTREDQMPALRSALARLIRQVPG